MTLELLGLLELNIAYVLVGAGLLASFGQLTTARVGVALPLGLSAVVVPSSYLALLGVPVLLSASVIGVVVIGVGCRRMSIWRYRPALPSLPRPRSLEQAVAVVLAIVLAVLLVYAVRTFAVRPVLDRDAWAVWMAKARLLYDAPSLAPEALRSSGYGPSPYPLALPTMEALGFGAMGRFDGTVIGVQFLILAASFPLALWTLFRDRARAWMVLLVSLAVLFAPQMMFQLMTKYADVPLAVFVGLGLAAGGAWLVRRESWLLVCFAAFLGIAGITKSEGLLFAVAGVVAFVCAARFAAPALLASAGALVVMLPWRVYCSVHGLATADYDLTNAFRPSYLLAHDDRVGPVAGELGRQLMKTQSWGLLTWVVLMALLGGLLAARRLVVGYVTTWLVLAGGGLFVTYWISVLPTDHNLTNSSYRTIVSLLVGGASLVPLLVLPRGARE